MARDAIPSNSTFSSIVRTLDKPEAQIRQILEVMIPCRRQHGNAHVRIGVTGEGKQPYFKIFSVATDGSHDTYGTFYGPTRQDDSWQAQVGAWSSASSSVEEIQELLGQVRGFGGRKIGS